jgi:hypothetical protein
MQILDAEIEIPFPCSSNKHTKITICGPVNLLEKANYQESKAHTKRDDGNEQQAN